MGNTANKSKQSVNNDARGQGRSDDARNATDDVFQGVPKHNINYQHERCAPTKGETIVPPTIIPIEVMPRPPPGITYAPPPPPTTVAAEPPAVKLHRIKARVDRVNVDTLQRTKDDIVRETVKELFEATDFEQVIIKTHRVKSRLEKLGLFDSINVYIDVSRGKKATKDGLDVTFNVRESKRLAGGVHTEVGNNEGALVVSLRTPNLFGRGERLQLTYSYGSKRTNNFNASYTKPLVGARDKVVTTSVYQLLSEAPASGYKLTEQGLLVDFGFNSFRSMRHNVQYDAAVRELGVLNRTTSFETREHAGHTLKSAVRHALSLDLRDDPIFPACGSFFGLKTELAGLGGDVGFVKNEAFVQGNYSCLEDCVLQAGLSMGHIRPLSDEKTFGIVDHFYLGGPMNLRGFEPRGCGPHSDGNSLGSDIYWAAGLHLFTPLPFRPGRGGIGDNFRTHAFVNFGNVGTAEKIEEIMDRVRITYGFGIAMRIGRMARLELNYCVPHSYRQGDEPCPGVQFGIGVQFV